MVPVSRSLADNVPELVEKVSSADVSTRAMAVGAVTVGVSLAAVMFTARLAEAERAPSETVTVKVSLALALSALIAEASGA